MDILNCILIMKGGIVIDYIEFIKKYKFIIIIIVFSLIVITGSAFLFKAKKNNLDDDNIEIFNNIEDETNDKFDEEKIKVDIKGAVKNPGVYELEKDSSVIDAINISGGLNENADTSIINLSKRVIDGNVIIIYTKEEVKKIKSGNVVIQYIENECNCPEYDNSACIDPDSLISDSSNEEIDVSNKKISINRATLEELQTLSGIGEAKAKLIIEYRTNNGLFKSIEEIKNIKGIGDAIFEKIKNNITI